MNKYLFFHTYRGEKKPLFLVGNYITGRENPWNDKISAKSSVSAARVPIHEPVDANASDILRTSSIGPLDELKAVNYVSTSKLKTVITDHMGRGQI